MDFIWLRADTSRRLVIGYVCGIDRGVRFDTNKYRSVGKNDIEVINNISDIILNDLENNNKHYSFRKLNISEINKKCKGKVNFKNGEVFIMLPIIEIIKQ